MDPIRRSARIAEQKTEVEEHPRVKNKALAKKTEKAAKKRTEREPEIAPVRARKTLVAKRGKSKTTEAAAKRIVTRPPPSVEPPLPTEQSSPKKVGKTDARAEQDAQLNIREPQVPLLDRWAGRVHVIGQQAAGVAGFVFRRTIHYPLVPMVSAGAFYAMYTGHVSPLFLLGVGVVEAARRLPSAQSNRGVDNANK